MIKDFTSILASTPLILLGIVSLSLVVQRDYGPKVGVAAALAATEIYPLLANFVVQLPSDEQGGAVYGWTTESKLSELEQ